MLNYCNTISPLISRTVQTPISTIRINSNVYVHLTDLSSLLIIGVLIAKVASFGMQLTNNAKLVPSTRDMIM